VRRSHCRENIAAKSFAFIGTDQAGMAVEHLFEQGGARAGETSEDGHFLAWELVAGGSPALEMF